MSSPALATTTTGDPSGISAVIAVLFLLAAALFTSRAITSSGAAEELERALRRLAETAERVRPMPLRGPIPEEAPPTTETETRPEPESRPRPEPRRPPPPPPPPVPLCLGPTGLTPIDPIPITWYKVVEQDYYPSPITIQNTDYFRDQPTSLPRGEQIGVLDEYWPWPGKLLQLVPEVRGPGADDFRDVLGRQYGFNWDGLQADHVQDLQWDGPDIFNNLWPLSSSANLSAGPRQNQHQRVTFCETMMGPLRNMSLGEMMQEGRAGRRYFGRWFIIRSIER